MRSKTMALWAVRLTIFLATALFGQSISTGDGIGKPIYTARPLDTLPSAAALMDAGAASVVTVPTWSNSFTYTVPGRTAKTFSYRMVGTSPFAGSATTIVPTQIIPIRLTFSNGVALDGTTRVAGTIASPIFSAFRFQTGMSQYGDAMNRGSFYSVVQSKSPHWHVLLGQPAVMLTENITVPPDAGLEFTGPVSGTPVGLVDYQWFSSQLQNLITTVHPDPRALLIFLTNDTYLFFHNPKNCCVVGFHSGVVSEGAGVINVHTYIWATYNDPGFFSVPLQDITALSHEVAEWYTDPLVSNIVPPWAQPGSSVCASNTLEVGDPIAVFPNLSFVVQLNGVVYHPQDEVFFSWFARQSPSTGLKGRYSYRGDKLFAPAPRCRMTSSLAKGDE